MLTLFNEQQAETQIKRRMGIGMRISERRLIDELARMGMNESIVRINTLILVETFYIALNLWFRRRHYFYETLHDLCLCQVRRALLIMHQREEVEYTRERRQIVRKA